VENTVVTTLVVGGIGLLLLFLALLILYGLMYWMTSVLKDPLPDPESSAREEPDAPEEATAVYRAAAIAVALAQARQAPVPVSTRATTDATSTGSVSSWWALHHDRQLTCTPHTRRLP
jgi:Na+-transporting methylmalonyl-CoA/oxaloacetate decarboxylase gamma subunit